ncbi:hypothetical protein BKP35_00850 [Anaerobacillus arseniciselenatis]|uniref:Uncharacterized protein n=1 Tax=Anaerobacillus arseniciselenatis TaxID=85682 RepID=A0A1S2LT88_9BACI|nr:hypothetical protein [Anaerobacillus arseniciselenatis]OIJ15576.1 hypothetical protein BKP35_00850 [Anaerobacillus arseniciselenatis]
MKTNKHKKFGKVILAGALVSTSILFSAQALANNELNQEEREKLLVEINEEGDDINHYETIEKLRNYIEDNVNDGSFASLHIDREEALTGTVVLSFTKELSPTIKDEIKALVEEPAKVSFRVVDYTEDELIEKQREINLAAFEETVFEAKGISVYHTSTDVINNRINIGISPFNAETAQVIYDYFDSNMIKVEEGQQVRTLMDVATEEAEATEEASDTSKEVTTISLDDAATDDKPGFFSKILNWLTQWFK